MDGIKIHKIVENYLQTSAGEELIIRIIDKYLNREKVEEKEENISNVNQIEENFQIKNYLIEEFKDIIELNESEGEKEMIKKIKDFILNLISDNKNLENTKSELEKKVKNLKEESRELEIDIKSLHNEKIQLKEEVNNLKKLLNEKEVEFETIKKAKNNLELKVNELEDKKKNYEKNLNEKKIELDLVSKKLLEEKKEKENIKQRLGGVEKLQELYEKYLKVSDEYREKIENLIKTRDVNSFISCCYNIGTLDDLWDSLRIEIKNEKIEDVKILSEIFQYFIEQQNKKYDESLYRVLIPEIGEEFNPTKHMSIDGSGSGKIEEVIFPGYGTLENKVDKNQKDEERKFKKIRKLAMVKVR